MKYYAAYGSNLSLEQMAYRCPGAVPIGTAELEGYKLMFRGSGSGYYLTVERGKKDDKVPLLIWRITTTDEASLDRYEGYPNFYIKRYFDLKVTSLDDENIGEMDVMMYVMTPDGKGRVRPSGMPTKYYIETCMDGYRRFGFDVNVMRKAYAESCKIKTR